MIHIEIPLKLSASEKKSPESKILVEAQKCRDTAFALFSEERYLDALERTVEAMRVMKEYPDYDNREFRALLAAVLFDLAEIHFALKDYKQAERQLETLFKVLEHLIAQDADRFAQYHILAMELSTRILRSRKKTMAMLSNQQITTSTLYSKVNSGVLEATDRLVESLRKTAQLLAATGDYREALKFFSEAIKYSKRRSGKVTRKEIKLTIEMAIIMMRIRTFRPRAARLLAAVLPHAITLGTIELEEDILALLEVINLNKEREPRWRMFLNKMGVRRHTETENTDKTQK